MKVIVLVIKFIFLVLVTLIVVKTPQLINEYFLFPFWDGLFYQSKVSQTKDKGTKHLNYNLCRLCNTSR